MKLAIKEDGKTRIKLHLPNALIKSRLLIFILKKAANMSNEDAKEIWEAAKISYKQLKSYIKQHGHFTLFEVFDAKEACGISLKV